MTINSFFAAKCVFKNSENYVLKNVKIVINGLIAPLLAKRI